ncbi:Retina-specific protein [Intoshia linei]|uniref:Large ribosomal subunit protein mL43 n=1 Tax=Intoshia linei TaxID=1819745 RepID=A0A177B4U9_9BILA|nr:Retina-specific protein [Intoshia linei]
MSHSHIPSTFISNTANGIGSYICQLKRLTLIMCKSHGSSRGIREFIEKDLIQFTKLNPGIAVYIQIGRHQPPKIIGEFLNGNKQKIDIANHDSEEIKKLTNFMRTRSGDKIEFGLLLRTRNFSKKIPKQCIVMKQI